MDQHRTVSIILPSYNRAYCIGQTIDSVLAQTFSNWDLIVCDDASTDNTELVVKLYCEQDSRIHYYCNPWNQGLPGNRNRGLFLSKGELVYFIEDDVVIEPDCLEILVNTLEELKGKGVKVGGVGSRSLEPKKQGRLMLLERHMGDQKRKGMDSPSAINKWTGLMYQNFAIDGKMVETVLLPSWSLFTRDALNKIGGYEYRAYNRFNYSHEETDMFTRLRKAGYKLFFQPKAVAHHKHETRGGTRASPIKYYYYYLGAHIIFLVRNFGWRAMYMIPACLVFITYGVIRSIPVLMKGDKNA